jgi:hypothetical protein
MLTELGASFVCGSGRIDWAVIWTFVIVHLLWLCHLRFCYVDGVASSRSSVSFHSLTVNLVGPIPCDPKRQPGRSTNLARLPTGADVDARQATDMTEAD